MKNASSSPSTRNLLTEEREEVMVSEKGLCLRKTHFLKPFVTSMEGSVSKLSHNDYQSISVSSSELKCIPPAPRISFSGIRFAQPHFISWLGKMEALHAPTWRKAGIFEAIKASTYNIPKNQSLILSVSEKWCPETKSFIFPWGEATITLEDVMVLLEFSVLGSPVFAPLESSEMIDSVSKLQRVRLVNRAKDFQVRQEPWISSFIGRGDQMEHEAFLALWLSHFVFPGKSRSVSLTNLPIAVRLARGERIALAPAVLSLLYRDLGELSRGKSTQNRNFSSLFKLVQVWVWERFKNLRPEAKEILQGEPRISRWGFLQQKTQNVSLSFDDFEWRPYTKPLKNWNTLRFYIEDAMWVTIDEKLEDEFVSFARCVRSSKLVGIECVEDYYPNRVAMQFGLTQDIPDMVTIHSDVSEKEAWDDYNKSLGGLKLYITSRLATTSVTERYRDWWLKSVSDFMFSKEMQKESTETYNARNTFDNNDNVDEDGVDIDVSPKILPLSQIIQRLELGFPVKRRRSKMRRIAKKYKTGELVNSLVSSGWKMNKASEDLANKRNSDKYVHMKTARENVDESSMDEEDVNMTVDQMITRSGKKCSNDADKTRGDASETLGKRTRRYMTVESDDDSGPCQKLASIKTEQRDEEDGETASKAQKTRQICDDIEVDVIGSTSEKKTLVVDEPCNRSNEQSFERIEDGEKGRCILELCSEVKKQEEIDERLRQRKLATKEMELKLEARLVKMEKTLAMIRKWKTRGNQSKN